MEVFNAPNISLDKKTTEENIKVIKGYLSSMADTMNYYLTKQQAEIEELKTEIEEIKKRGVS